MLSFSCCLNSSFERITGPGSGRNTKKQFSHHSVAWRKGCVVGHTWQMPAKITGCGVDVSTASAAGVLGSRALLRIPKATNKWFTSGCFGFNPKELQLSWESFHRLETSSGTNPKTYWISFFFFFCCQPQIYFKLWNKIRYGNGNQFYLYFNIWSIFKSLSFKSASSRHHFLVLV